MWELKRPQGNGGLNTLKSNIRRGLKDGTTIIVVDTTYPGSIDFSEYEVLIAEFYERDYPEFRQIREIIVIDGNGGIRSFQR